MRLFRSRKWDLPVNFVGLCNKPMQKLEAIEQEIRTTIRKFSSADLLLAINSTMKERAVPGNKPNVPEIPPFIAAAIAAFAIRFSNPHRGYKNITWSILKKLSDLVFKYLSADPITHDEGLADELHKSNPIFDILRIAGNKFSLEVNTYAFIGQPLLLYGELPKEMEHKRDVPHFDFYDKFQKITGLSLEDFICCGFVAWAAFSSKTNSGLTREYFEKARSLGMTLPDDEGILNMLNCITADPNRFRQKYAEMKQKDRLFCMYDFNPLLTYPILRPWAHHNAKSMLDDRIVAPLPDLVAYRISTGIFYEMFNSYNEEFSRYFGFLFEAYVGRLLKAFVPAKNLYSEDMIREKNPSYSGKVPDWIVLEGSTAILIECKATRFSLPALSTGAEESVNKSLAQVLKGLKQLHEFRTAIIEKNHSLMSFTSCSKIKPVLVTLEPLYLINTVLFREHIDALIEKEAVTDLPWRILSVKEIESFEPHLKSGIQLSDILSALNDKPFNQVLDDCIAKTGLSYKDSLLYGYDQEMYQRLGIVD